MGKGDEACPLCGADLTGDLINKDYRYADWDAAPQFYSRTIMVEIPEVYDGGLYYMCPDCNGAWHRWTNPRMRDKAQKYIDQQNKKAGA